MLCARQNYPKWRPVKVERLVVIVDRGELETSNVTYLVKQFKVFVEWLTPNVSNISSAHVWNCNPEDEEFILKQVVCESSFDNLELYDGVPNILLFL